MNNMSAKELLLWQIEMGADEFICNDPINRFNIKPAITPINTENPANDKQPPSNIAARVKNDDSAYSTTQIIEQAIKLAESCKTIEELKDVVSNFNLLSIQKTATNTIFLNGNENSDILIIAEVPTSEDDESGQILSANAGKLWDEACKYITLNKGDMAIIPSIFWRPPGNRRPTNTEIKTCIPFIKKAICLINPKIIIFLGAMGHNSFFNNKDTISKITGTIKQLEININSDNKTLIVDSFTLQNPVNLLKQPVQKKQFWQNLLILSDFISDKITT